MSKHPFIMRGLLFFLFTIVIVSHASASIERSGLKAALDKGWIKLAAISTGNLYRAKALRLKVTNQTKSNIQLTIEPALIFRPDDSSYQDLVLPGTEMLVIAAGSSGELTVQTFCGKAHALGPARELPYSFKKRGDTIMIQVLGYINKHRLYDGLGQSAVWALTDYKNLEAVIDGARPKESAELLALMVRLTGWATPDYFKVYKTDNKPAQPVAPDKVLKIVADFEWKITEPVNLRMGIYNEGGEEVQPVFFKEFTKGGYRLRVEFEAENVKPGKYYIRLLNAAGTLKEKMVVVD